MKFIKKLICITCCIMVLVVSNDLSIFAETIYNESFEEKMYSLGFSEAEIDELSSEEKENFLNAEQINCSTQYYCVSSDGEIKKVTYLQAQEGAKREKEKELQKQLNGCDAKLFSYSQSDEEYSSGDGYLRQSIYIMPAASKAKVNGKQVYFVSYSAEWLNLPNTRGKDTFGFSVGGAQMVYKDDIVAYYRTKFSNGSVVQYDLVNDYDTLSTYSGGIAVWCRIPAPVTSPMLSACTHHICGYIVPTTKDTTVVSAAGLYYHQTAILQVTPSISGVSMEIGISLASSSKFDQMLPNPYVTYTVE